MNLPLFKQNNKNLTHFREMIDVISDLTKNFDVGFLADTV